MEVVAFVGQFLPSGGGFVSIFPFGGFSMFPCCLPGASVGQFGDFRFPGTEQRMVATESHTPCKKKGKSESEGNEKHLIRHEYLSMGWDVMGMTLHTYPKPTSPSPASITSLMPLLGKRGEVIECRKDRETGSQDQGRERHSFLK